MNTSNTRSAPFLTSVAAIALLVIMLVTTVPSLLAAVFGGAATGQDPAESVASLIEEHSQLASTYEQRFNGRSVFFRPPAPVVAPPPVEPQREKPKRDVAPPPPPPPPPGPPANYQGPAVSVVLGNKVLFAGFTSRDSGQWISVGEEVNGLRVLETNAPRSVRVAYQRGEYDVPVFKWEMPFFRDASEAGKPIPGLISSPAPPSSQPSPSTRPGSTGRDRARAVAAPPAAFEPAVDDERDRQQDEEQAVEDPSVVDEDFHPAGEPDVPEFEPGFDPDALPDEAVEDPQEDGQDEANLQENDPVEAGDPEARERSSGVR